MLPLTLKGGLPKGAAIQSYSKANSKPYLGMNILACGLALI